MAGIDKDRSGPADGGSSDPKEQSDPDVMWDVYLQLSSWVSGQWLRLFQSEWMRSPHDPKPRITAYTHQLVLHSPLHEVEHHIPEIRRVVEQTNARYRDHLHQQGRVAAEREEREQMARERLEDLEKRLGFE